MAVGEDFREFCCNLTISRRDSIAARCGRITKRLNLDFWNSESETYHSFYTGSYGRGTAIDTSSDVDMLFQLPYAIYERYNAYVSNGQAALLQIVRESIKNTYAFTEIGSDGCVVTVPFDDGITFEVMPAFINKDGSYTFADSTNGGKWKNTDPKPEIKEIADMDGKVNGNLKNLCKMTRAWKATWEVPIGGLLIDTLSYNFIREWEYRDKSCLYYDWITRDFFGYLTGLDPNQNYWLSPGANQYVWKTGSFEYKAKRGRNIALEAIEYQRNEKTWSARQKWREIYGSAYPA